MKVLNAGLEKIEFGFNQNTRNKKEGGLYTILPGEFGDVPETSLEAIMNPLSGPHLRGLVVLEVGTDVKEAERKGLESYTAFVQQRIEWECQRQEEKKQNGISVNSDSIELRRFKELLKKAEEKLNVNTTSDGNEGAPEPQRPSNSSPKVSDNNNKKSA